MTAGEWCHSPALIFRRFERPPPLGSSMFGSALSLAPEGAEGAPVNDMSRTRPFQTLLLLALTAAPNLVACSSSTDSPSPTDPHSSAGVVREGGATAAQLDTFLHHKAREWAWAGGQFDTPDEQATLAAGTPQRFSWHADPADFATGGSASELVMTHLLEFNTANGGTPLRVFTTLPEYTPDTVAWQKLIATSEAITVSLTTGTFVGADVPEDGGPFIGQALTFTIE